MAVLATILATSVSPIIQSYQSQISQTPATSSTQFVGLCEAHSPADLGISRGAPTGAGTTSSGTSGAHGPTPEQLVALAHEACLENMKGFQSAYQLTFYFALVALILGALLPGWPFKWSGRGGQGSRLDDTAAGEASDGQLAGLTH